MNTAFRQDMRMGRLNTALGKDVLVLQRFEGTDRLNGLFDYSVKCLGASSDIDFDALIGTHATVTLTTRNDSDRPFDGIVTEVRWLGTGENGHRYDLRLRPWLWLASLKRNQRIFHNKTVVQILEDLLAAYGSAGSLEPKLSQSYPELEYTVQYRESDLDFAARLMERFAINYHFHHEDGAHKMVLTDIVEEHDSIGTIPFKPFDGHHQEDIEHFWEWAPARRLTTGAIRLTDYNFKTPLAAMEVERVGDAGYANGQIESFDYPGDYPDQGMGKAVAGLRTDRERGQDRRFEAVGDVPAFAAGLRVKLGGDEVPGGGEEYLCLTASHSYTSDNYGSGGASGDGYAFSGQYLLMPASAPLAPERKTAPAIVQGPQTAVVVGDGEIDCDEYGRILVRFHWDLDAAHSMRCRVSQNWAGNGWGGMVIPRIGMEVVVEFLEGDPDKPLVTGCVYNGKNDVPYELPKHKTRSTFKTDTHKGKGFNELRFEDMDGEEEIFVHAEKDRNAKVENNQSERVNVNKVESVGHNKATEVSNNLLEAIGGNMDLRVGPGNIGTVTPSSAASAPEGMSTTPEQYGKVGSKLGKGDLKMSIERNKVQTIGRDHDEAVEKDKTTDVGDDYRLKAGKTITLTAGDQIVFKVGQSRIVMKDNGQITVNGKVMQITTDKLIRLLSDHVRIN